MSSAYAVLQILATKSCAQEGTINENEFEVPKICPEKPEDPSNAGRFHKHVGGLARMRSLLPNAHYGALLIISQQSAKIILCSSYPPTPAKAATRGAAGRYT